jgi:hypothetical protein
MALGERLRKDIYEALRAGKVSSDDNEILYRPHHTSSRLALPHAILSTERLSPTQGWNETAFIVTWDDPGGFFDHVPPPGTGSAPPPDGHRACRDTDSEFQFDRLGARLPVLLISPWVEKGTVIGKAEGPTPTSEYDGTSIIATVKKLFQLPNFLTKRGAGATF